MSITLTADAVGPRVDLRVTTDTSPVTGPSLAPADALTNPARWSSASFGAEPQAPPTVVPAGMRFEWDLTGDYSNATQWVPVPVTAGHTYTLSITTVEASGPWRLRIPWVAESHPVTGTGTASLTWTAPSDGVAEVGISVTRPPTSGTHVVSEVGVWDHAAPGVVVSPLSITRTMGGVTATVRGADQITGHAGVLALADWEVLFQTPITYTAHAGDQASEPVTVVIDEDRAWLRCVLEPALALPVWISEHAEASRNARTTLLRPIGRAAPVALTDVRERQSGASRLVTWDDEGRDMMGRVLASGGVVLLTGPADWRLGPLYMVVGDAAEARPGNLADTPIRLWTLDWVEVDPPVGLVAPPGRTWGDIVAAGYTWADLAQMRWIDIVYPPALPDPAPTGPPTQTSQVVRWP